MVRMSAIGFPSWPRPTSGKLYKSHGEEHERDRLQHEAAKIRSGGYENHGDNGWNEAIRRHRSRLLPIAYFAACSLRFDN